MMNIRRLFTSKDYQPAQIEERAGAYTVCYSYRKPETDEFETFYISSSNLENTPIAKRKEYADKLCTSTNKALGRYYNPFENGDEEQHQTQEDNVVQLAQLSISKLFLFAARRWAVYSSKRRYIHRPLVNFKRLYRTHWGAPLSRLITFACLLLYYLYVIISGTFYEFSWLSIGIIFFFPALCSIILCAYIAPKYAVQWAKESRSLPRKLHKVWMWPIVAIQVITILLILLTAFRSSRY